jgi:sugar phosphate isomerase/epimerase
VNADPSHCWEGEDWQTRFTKVGSRIYGCHVKNFVIQPHIPLRKAEANWQKRAMQFCDIGSGDLNMVRYVELLIQVGYPQRFCAKNKTKTAPLVVEAESAYRDLDATSADGIAYTRDKLCFPMAAGSFEEGMGA